MINLDLLGNWVLHGLVQEEAWDGAWAWSEAGLQLPPRVRVWLALFLYQEGVETLSAAARAELRDNGFDPLTGMVLEAE